MCVVANESEGWMKTCIQDTLSSRALGLAALGRMRVRAKVSCIQNENECLMIINMKEHRK